ncbi:MAG: hypothetical protein ACOX81_00345 [Candidatus Heteroscillospira sp.]|jgi:hypothetical protein
MNRPPISLAMAVTQRGVGEKCAQIFAECGVCVQYIGLGHGTANSEIMDYLGLDEPEKDVVLGLALTPCVPEAFTRLGDELGFMGRGTGVAFSVPVSSINSGTARRAGLENTERSSEPMQESFEMIVTVLDGGLTDIVMDSAKAAGARGGTVLKCRDMSPDAERRVFGVTVRPDKEILMMVVPRAGKDKIMKAICSTVLRETEREATCFSLPIDDVMGLHV